MPKIDVAHREKTNRSARFDSTLRVRVSADDLELLDHWITANAPGQSRPEAVRRIVRLAALWGA